MVPNKLSVQARSMPMYWQNAQGIYARCPGMGKRCPLGMVIVCLANGITLDLRKRHAKLPPHRDEHSLARVLPTHEIRITDSLQVKLSVGPVLVQQDDIPCIQNRSALLALLETIKYGNELARFKPDAVDLRMAEQPAYHQVGKPCPEQEANQP